MRADTAEAGYTVTEMADEQSTEIFDDLYLGLLAGGALRKQRRGESLTEEEQEALGRWQRLSAGRKAIAIGGFAVGTFGLGFTLGGLVFGRVDVPEHHVDERREDGGDRDREQDVEAAEQDPDRGDGDEHDERRQAG